MTFDFQNRKLAVRDLLQYLWATLNPHIKLPNFCRINICSSAMKQTKILNPKDVNNSTLKDRVNEDNEKISKY